MKLVAVTKENYTQYRYVKDYEGGSALEKLTDEELKAQKFYIRKLYAGMKGSIYRNLKKIAIDYMRQRKIK